MKYLLAMICLVVMIAPASYAGDPLPWELVLPDDGTQRMPTFLTRGAYDRPVVQNPGYASQSLFVNGWFADFFAKKKDAPIPFELLNIKGKSRLPFPDCTNPAIVPGYGSAGAGATGFVKVWYEKGLPEGRCYMPGGIDPDYHILWVFGSPMQRGNFRQWWLQTDPRWADDPYGRNGISTNRAYACCATCAAMQLSAWGWGYTPGSLVADMMKYKDGFVGKSGLQFNWDRLQKMTGCGYRGRVAISEMLERGMTTQAGVRHNSKGIAGHWVYPWANAFEMLWYIICDPMNRGSIDREIRIYDDKRDQGCWETDTRSVYRKSYGFNFLLSDRPITQGTGVKVAGAVIAGPVKIDEEYLAQNMGRIAPCLLMKEYLAQRPESVAATALSASSAVTQTQTISEPLDESALVDWSYWGSTGFVAWAQSGDVHLKLKSSGVIVAEEKEEISENDMTEEVVTDLTLEASPLKGGTYTLEITGAPGTVFEVQTFRYLPSSEEAVDILISGTIDAGGVYRQSFTQVATAIVIDVAGLQYVPEGSSFVAVNTNVTAKLPTGQYAVQSQYPLQSPMTMTYIGYETIDEFGQYQIRGIVGPNRTITVSEAVLVPYTSSVNCPPIYRTNKQAFDKVAGYRYTKLVGMVSEAGDDYFILDNIVRVKMADSVWWLTVGSTISICGVSVNDEFVANFATLVQY